VFSFTTLNAAGEPPTRTVVAQPRFTPETVTRVPPVCGPKVGVRYEIEGVPNWTSPISGSARAVVANPPPPMSGMNASAAIGSAATARAIRRRWNQCVRVLSMMTSVGVSAAGALGAESFLTMNACPSEIVSGLRRPTPTIPPELLPFTCPTCFSVMSRGTAP
jgi:hypothetical protein